jgi:amino acid transporter
MILAVLLSIVGATQTAMVSGARIAFAMGDDKVLPPALGRTHPRHRTPYIATLLFSGLSLVVLWLYLLGSSSIQGSFDKVISSVGLCFALFYAATGLAMAVYYRKLAATSTRNLVELAVIPLASAAFLLWVAWKSVPGLGGWNSSIMHYLYVMLAIGVVLLLIARQLGQTTYFKEPTQAYRADP